MRRRRGNVLVDSDEEAELALKREAEKLNKKAKLIRIPKFAEIPFPSIMEPNLVIEYYSR